MTKKKDDADKVVLGTGAAGDPEHPAERAPYDQAVGAPVDLPAPGFKDEEIIVQHPEDKK
jgi:hypothetical protein